MSLIRILLLGVCACVLNTVLCGQTTTANLYGIVRDSSGAIVPGAMATITNQGTSQSFSATTDTSGEFAFSFLRAATYRLAIEAAGFKRFISSGLELSSGQQSRLQLTLELGAVTESVTVDSSASMVNTVSAEQQQSIDSTRVTELPLARRNFTSLLSIGTGVIMSGSDHGTVRMNGMGQSGTNISLDGTYASSNPEGRSAGAFQNFNQIDVVSIEAIQEVQTVKGVAPAEYGNALGGQVNVITRSGTNTWHGSAFHNFQSEELNARPQTLVMKAPAIFNQFGGSIGGPIRKNQIFVFGAFEGYRDRTAQVLQGNVPTASIREELVRAVPDYQLAFAILPLPNQPHDPAGTAGLFIGPGSRKANDNHAVIKGDIKTSPLSNLALTYTRMRPDSLQPRIALNGANDRTYLGSIDRGAASYILSRPVWTSETRFGFDWNDTVRGDRFFDEGRDPRGPESTFGGRRIGYLITTLGWDTQASEFRPIEGRTWSLDQKLAWIRGRHSFKFGGVFLHQQGYRTDPESPRFQYSSRADLFANRPSSLRPTFGTPAFRGTLNTMGFFIQDDFRVSKTLVLNLGLRYDYFGAFRAVPTTDSDAFLYNLDGLRDASFNFGPYRDPEKPYNPDRGINLQPRVGFSFNPDGRGRTAVRGGFGVMFSPHMLGAFYVSAGSKQVPSRVTYSRQEIERFGFRWPLYNDDMRLVVEREAALSGRQEIRSVYDPNLQNPYSLVWSLGVQHAFNEKLAVETAYVATRGVKFLMHRWFNQADRITGLRPNSNLGEGYYIDNSQSTSYHSWQTSVRQRYAHNFTGAFHYTWGKAAAIGGGGDTGSYYQGDNPIVNQDFFNARADRGPVVGDVTHAVAADWIYQLPAFPSVKKALARHAFGGWEVSGVANAYSGEATTLLQPTSREGSRPDYIGGAVVLGDFRESLQYLNKAAFAPVSINSASGASLRAGNVGVGAIRGPSRLNLNIALGKQFSISEQVRLRFRADAFNALNTTNLSGLDTNITSRNFGRLNSTRGARTMQLNLRLTW